VGQQQRVAAARAMLGAPPLVIADEPTSALDAARRDDFMALLLTQCRASGSTLVFVSHDERLAAAFDERLSLPVLNRALHGAQDPVNEHAQQQAQQHAQQQAQEQAKKQEAGAA